MKAVSKEYIAECCKAQEEYTEKMNYPLFMPYTGRCFSCRKNIFQDGYNLEYASSSLITGCPHCHTSFCE